MNDREQNESLADNLKKPTADQRRQMTILFGDLSGFTSMSEFMDAEQLKDLMDALWRRLDAIIVENGGRIDKHMGDAVMALWSEEATREDDPENAIRAALAMQAALSEFPKGHHTKPESDGKHERRVVPELQMRIGINTGPVLFGSIGSIGEITAMGDEVNLASRLEHAAPVGGILISHSTYLLVRNLFDVRALDPIQIKGKTDPVRVYEVLRLRPRTFRFVSPTVEGIETRMIGRQAELERLRDSLKTVISDEEPQIVTVLGEAGMGKSRLLYEFNNELDPTRQRITIFAGRASQRQMQAPYSLFRDMLFLRFGIQDSDSPAFAREKLVEGVSEFFGSDDDPIICAHFIGRLVGLDFSDSPHLRGILNDPQQIRARAVAQAVLFFRMVSRRSTAVLYLEDVHWADDESLDLLDHVSQTCSSSRLFVLYLARPSLLVRRPSWGEGQLSHIRSQLHPLSKTESRALVSHILRKIEHLAQPLQELVVNVAEGNPFFIEEVIKLLIDQRVVLTETGWHVNATRFFKVSLPTTLKGVLQARLDELSAPEKTLLQFGAVIGRAFWKSAIEKLTSVSMNTVVPNIADTLDVLRRKEFIHRRETSSFDGTEEYVFKHALLRDVAYDTVLKRERNIYHNQVAEWIIKQSSERADEYSGAIAEHFELSDEHEKAALWYGCAGDLARQTYAPNVAIRYYKKALEEFLTACRGPVQLSTLQTSLVGWYEGLGYAQMWQAQFSEAIQSYTHMLHAAERGGDKLRQARALNHLAYAHEELNQYAAMLDRASQAEQIATSALSTGSTDGELARALNLQGWAHRHLGRPADAMTLAERSLALAKDPKEGTPKQRAHSFQLLSGINTLLGNFGKAYSYCEEALLIQKALGDRRNVEILINTLGEIDRSAGDFKSALSHYQEASAIAHEIGDLACEIVYVSNVGAAYIGLAQHAQAESELKRAISLAPAGHFIFSETYRFLAEACLNQEKWSEAADAGKQALALGQQCNNLEFIGGAWRVLGVIAARVRDSIEIAAQLYDAEQCFSNSLIAFEAASSEVDRARTLREWALCVWERNDRDHANRMWEEALAIFTRFDLKTEIEPMLETYTRICSEDR